MSEIIVLDTHIWLWYINGNDEQLPAGWLTRIESADTLRPHIVNPAVQFSNSQPGALPPIRPFDPPR